MAETDTDPADEFDARVSPAPLDSVERFRELNDTGAFSSFGLPAKRLTIETRELAATEAAEIIVSRLKLKRSD